MLILPVLEPLMSVPTAIFVEPLTSLKEAYLVVAAEFTFKKTTT